MSAAGNYVEIEWRARILTPAVDAGSRRGGIGRRFVRIHRGHLVRRKAVRRIEMDKSGDFTVTLVSGATVRGSRRYRDRL